jgi:hypothetical protein
MKKYWLFGMVAAVVCVSALPAPAALDAYMYIQLSGGAKQGTFKGDSIHKPNKSGHVVYPETHSNTVLVQDLTFTKGGCGDLVVTVLMTDGTQQSTKMTDTPSGDCTYKILVKPIGNTPPFGIKSFGLSSAGNKFKPRNVTDFTDADWNPPQMTPQQQVKFAYRQIEWTYQNGSKGSQDAWDAK